MQNNLYKITDFQYNVSMYCPGKCVNCGIWQYSKEEITKDEIDSVMFEKVIQSPLLNSANYIQLTGGEVQLSPQYVETVRLIAKYRPEAFIHTNISGWYPATHLDVVKRSLEYADADKFRVDISLDGPPDVYSKIRLVNHGYKKAVETIDLLKDIVPQLRVVFTIYKENCREIPWLINFAKEKGIGYYFEFVRESSFLNNSGELSEAMKFSQEDIEFIEHHLKDDGFIERQDRHDKWERAKSVYDKNIMPFDCHMGTESLIMNPQGEIYPCLEFMESLKMGNIKAFDGDLEKLLYSEQALNVIDSIKKRHCQPCGMLCAHKIALV